MKVFEDAARFFGEGSGLKPSVTLLFLAARASRKLSNCYGKEMEIISDSVESQQVVSKPFLKHPESAFDWYKILDKFCIEQI